MSVAELKERHLSATETVNSLRDRLRQRRLLLLDTDGFNSELCFFLFFFFQFVFNSVILCEFGLVVCDHVLRSVCFGYNFVD